ncbi:MAG: DUF6261 family protein [Alistipes sp.]|nr:DUF6261 family protein [Alistipes sp.]
MEKIRTFRLSHLRNDEHFEFVRHICHLIDDYGAAALGVEPQRAALAAAFADEDAALRKIAGSALTSRIADADRARDETYNGLVNTVRAAQTHYNAAVREAAAGLAVVMNAYKGVAGLNFEEETSALHNLLIELTVNHMAEAELLGLGGWIGELDRRNVAFEELMEERFEERADRPTVEMTAARRAVDAACVALSDMVYARALVASADGGGTVPAARFAELIARWNETVARTRDILARRAAPGKTADGDDALDPL